MQGAAGVAWLFDPGEERVGGREGVAVGAVAVPIAVAGPVGAGLVLRESGSSDAIGSDRRGARPGGVCVGVTNLERVLHLGGYIAANTIGMGRFIGTVALAVRL